MRFLVVYILCCGGHATRLSLWNLLMNKLYGSDSQQLVHLLLESLVWQQVTYQKITQKRIPFSYPFFFLCIRMVSSFIFCRWFFIEIPFLFLCSEPVSFGNRRRRWSSVASSWRPCSSCASTRWRPTLAIWPPWRRCCWRRCCSRATPSSASASSAASSCCGVSTPSSASGSSPSLLSSASSSWMYVF